MMAIEIDARHADLDSRETSVVATTVLAIVLAKIYWISRIGFDNPIGPVAEALGVALFLIAAPLVIMRLIRGSERSGWWTSQSFVMLTCIVATMVAGIVAGRTGVSVAPTIAAAGAASALWTVVRWLRRDRVRASIAFVVGASAFSVWCAGVVWGSRYKMPLFWETLSHNANIHHDTFYYASMANMIETYGVPSTGLDGIPLIRYHFGSMWFYGKLADLLNTDVLSFYSLGYAVIVLPLFLASLLLFSTELRSLFVSRDEVPMRRDWKVWLVVLAATVGFIPADALDAFGVWNSNALISESYLIAMPVFFLLIGVSLAFWRSVGEQGKVRAGTGSLLFLVVLVPATIATLGFLKLSFMVLSFALLLYLAVRLGLLRQAMVAACVVVSVIAVALTFPIVSLPAQNQGISILDFMRYNSAVGWQQFFPLIHLLWTWVYVAMRIWEDGARDTRQLMSSIKSRRLVDVEVLLVIAIGGFLPGEIVSIHGGSAVYFSDIQRWAALSFIIARLGIWVREWKLGRRIVTAEPQHPRGWRSVRLATVIAIFVAAPFAVTMIVNLVQWPVRDLRSNLALRRELIARAGGAPTGVRSLAQHAKLADGVKRSPYYPIVMALREIARLPEDYRRRTLLFIPQSNQQYWTMFTADGRCTFTPLIAPGIAAMAMIDGMPSWGCKVTEQYNMTSYEPRTRPQTAGEVTDAAICAKARAKGFSQVLVLDAPGNSAPRRRRIDCYLP
jgi:hypothetical protein